VRVVLGGQGADELFAGYDRYRFPHAISAARTGGLRESYAGMRRAGIRRLAVDFAKRILPLDPAAMLVKDAPPATEVLGWDFERQLLHEFRWYLPMLLHVEDRTSMAWSIESRVPFLDDEITEYVLAIPATEKIKSGSLKWMLREAARGIVPDLILDRKDKRGLPTPLGLWMRGPLRGFVSERLTDPILLRSGLVNVRKLQQLFDAHLAGVRDFGDLLWRPLVVSMWLAQEAGVSDSGSDVDIAVAG